jgi:flagellar hook protein FlgE
MPTNTSNVIRAGSKKLEDLGSLSARSAVNGQRGSATDGTFKSLVIGNKSVGILYETVSSLNQQGGTIQQSSNPLDMALPDGEHFFVVAENGDRNRLALSTAGNFIEYNGRIVLATNKNMVLMVSSTTGSVATTKNLGANDLVPADISYFRISQPELSKLINISQTIIDNNRALTNASNTLNLSSSQKDKLIIDPSIKGGDQLLMDITGGRDLHHSNINYGGVTNGYSISSFPMFGAKTVSANFTAGIADGNQLFISTNGNVFNFTFKAGGSATASKGEFSNLEGLRSAIAAVGAGSLLVELKNNTLYIGAKDAKADLTFSDSILGKLVSTLGFTNVPAAAGAGEQRYNTQQGLLDIVKNLEGVDAGVPDSNKVEFSVGRADESVQIRGDARGWTTTSGVFITKYDDAANVNGGKANEITIASTGHGLQVGDFIDLDLNGGAALAGLTLANGKYVVTSVTGNDSFNIASQGITNYDNLAKAITNNAAATWNANLALNTSYNVLVANRANGIKWAKSVGASYGHQKITGTTSIANGARNVVVTKAGHGLVNDDWIYIDGGPTTTAGTFVQAGYYKIQNVADVNTFTINGVININAPAAGLTPNINYFKVTDVVAETDVAVAGNLIVVKRAITTVDNSNLATISIAEASQNYKVGDFVSLQGLAAAGWTYGAPGSVINNGDLLKVTGVTADSVTIQLPNNGLAANCLNTAVGGNIYLNKAPAMFEKLGLARQKMQWDAIYNPNVVGDPTKVSLSELYSRNENDYPLAQREQIKKLKQALQTSETVEAFNEAGNSVKLRIVFAVLDKAAGKVVYEVFAEEKENGVYPIETKNSYGLVASGDLTFDENGNLQAENIAPVQLAFKDSSTISLDLSLATDGNGIRLTSSGLDTDISSIKASCDGFGASERSSLDVKDNQLYVTYRNGQTHAPFNIAFGTAANVSFLEQITGGLYIASSQSGALELLNGGLKGMPQIINYALEYMGDDVKMESTMEAVGTAQFLSQMATMNTIQHRTDKDMLDQTRSAAGA